MLRVSKFLLPNITPALKQILGVEDVLYCGKDKRICLEDSLRFYKARRGELPCKKEGLPEEVGFSLDRGCPV